MFIEQLKSFERSKFIYYVPMLVLIGAMFIPQFFSDAQSTQVIIEKLIATVGKNVAFVSLVIPLSILCIVLLLWVKFFHKQTITSLTTGRSKINWNRILFSFGLWSFIIISGTAITYFSEPERYSLIFDPLKFSIFFVLACLLLPLQTSFEEYFFRGYLMQGIGLAIGNKWFPLIATSVLFGLVHISNPEVGQIGMVMMFYYIGTGLLLGIFTLMDDGLELALGFHAANNLVGALLVTSDWSALQTNSVFKDLSNQISVAEFVIPLLVVYPILIIVFAKKYGWTNWKEKLFGSV